jgi:hypothetical protein
VPPENDRNRNKSDGRKSKLWISKPHRRAVADMLTRLYQNLIGELAKAITELGETPSN